MIPTAQEQEFLKDLHVNHLGEEKTLLQAKNVHISPGITEDVKQYLRISDTCQSKIPKPAEVVSHPT